MTQERVIAVKRAIVKKSLLIVLAALLFFGAVIAVFIQNDYVSGEQQRLRELVTVLRATTPRGGYDAYVRGIEKAADGLSVTLMDENGKVLAGTSEAGAFSAAVASGARQSGYDSYIESSPDGGSVLYAAGKMENGMLLGISEPIGPGRLLELLPAVLAGLAGAFLIAYLFAAHTENRLLMPVRYALGALQSIQKGTSAEYPAFIYDEYIPEAAQIGEVCTELGRRFWELTSEREHIDYILNNMSEGLVVLDKNLRILMINKSAEAFFNEGTNVSGQNLLRLTHLRGLVEAARKAARHAAPGMLDIDASDGRTLRIILSPVQGDTRRLAEGGAILFITDVTAVRKAEQIRSDFVANVSHELKTPLTSIKGFTELMESGIIRDPEKMQKYLSLIREESERMIELITDILELSELESSATDTGKIPVSLRHTAQRAVESIALKARDKEVSVEVSGDAGTLQANPDRMMQLALNLIDNAVKYNVPGGRVCVGVRTQEDGVALTVADTGVGIPREAQERVFERFYRVDKGRSRRLGGTGLGLSIVKHIAGLYHGRITLESEPGKGTTIRVFFPASDENSKI